MSPYAFALVWVLHSTLLGLVALAVPTVFRLRHPGSLVRWWGCATLAVLVMPVVVALLPAKGGTTVTTPAFLDAAVVAATASSLSTAGGPLVAPALVLFLLWATGAVARLVWVWMGHRRLRRIVDAAMAVTGDAALTRARELAPRAAFAPFAAHRVPVHASTQAGPYAYGWWPVGVLVPTSLQDRPEQERVAVYLHELVHVGRGDTVRAYADELWRVLFWWQPATWWLMARLQLAREHEVDAIVVERLGAMRPYVEALLWCSDLAPSRLPGLAISGTRHGLVQRVSLLGKGRFMTRTRRWTTELASVMVFAGLVAVSSTWSPLRAFAAAQSPGAVASGPGPLERVAHKPTLDAPAPRRIAAVEPVWSGDGHRFRVHLVVDHDGTVPEARAVGRYVGERVPAEEIDAAQAAVLEAVRQWRFERPVQAPMLIATDVDAGVVAVPPVAPTATRPPLRVGGGVRPPTKVLDVAPVYPQVAKDARVQGVVIVEATVAEDGTVSDARVVRSIPLLDEAALTAVKQWRYTPTWLNGEAVPVQMVMTINFTLQ